MSSAARPASEHRRLPVGVAEGTRAVGSPSFAYFSWRSKKSESPVGAKPGISTAKIGGHMGGNAENRLHDRNRTDACFCWMGFPIN